MTVNKNILSLPVHRENLFQLFKRHSHSHALVDQLVFFRGHLYQPNITLVRLP